MKMNSNFPMLPPTGQNLPVRQALVYLAILVIIMVVAFALASRTESQMVVPTTAYPTATR